MLKKLLIVLIILGAGYGLVRYSTFFEFSPSSTVPQKVKVRLSWVHQAQFAGFYVAQEKGFYEKHGLDVELLDLDADKNQIEEMENGDVDFSIMEAHQLLGDTPELTGNLKAVAAIYQINPHALAARADSGITSPKDFTGKTIGFAGGDSEGNALFRIFVNEFADPDSVTYVNLGFDTVTDVIEKRADVVDVYRVDQPYLLAQKGVPLNIIPLESYGFSTYGDLIVTNAATIQNDSEMVQKFVSASLAGWEYALENPQEAVEITMGYTTGDYNDADYQQHILTESVPLIRGTASTLGSMEFVSWSTLYESMRRAGVITEEFDVRGIYTTQFVR